MAMGKLSDYVEPAQILDHMLTHDPLDRRLPVYHKGQAVVISGIRGYIAGVKIAAWFARIVRRIKR